MKNIFSTLVLEQDPSYVEKLEKKYDIELPPVFKAFVQTFKFGEFEPTSQHDVIHKDEKIGYDGFNTSLERSIEVYNSQGEFYTKPKLLPIIISGFYHQGICLDLKKKPDQILLMKDHNDLVLVANNILEFISQLQEVHWNDF
ncbi:hypothetical protein GCM10022393_41670 [Aquimarina addita]|uniref:Knr4/Smi1-like domain-containing protein n=1 Tax=Aquimarina addita TaxID=870485 RepID=A0ABP6UXG2_9FLAO